MSTSTLANKKKLNIYAYAIEGLGHMLATVGALQPLLARGHSVTFLTAEAKFKDTYEKYGFKVILIDLPKPEESSVEPTAQAENPIKKLAAGLIDTGFLGPTPLLEKMRFQMDNGINIFEGIFGAMPELNKQMEVIINRDKPDAFVVDSFVIPPAVLMANLPWIFSCSAQPLCVLPRSYSEGKLPPYGNGFPTDSKPSDWTEYLPVYREYRYKIFGGKFQEEICAQFDCPRERYPLSDGEALFVNSPYLNLYGYPEELDYPGDGFPPLPETFVRIDAFMRSQPNETYELPEAVKQLSGEKIIYFSLGSMGSVDVKLMQKITNWLTKDRQYKVIVSKGPLADEYELPANAWGEGFLPQTALLPFVDLVVTHGGNNTVTETLSFGKPMIVLPLFGDQYDNAQRVEEKGFGFRFDPYTMNESEFLEAIRKLLADEQLKERLEKTAKRLKASPSKELAADRIEATVDKYWKSNVKQ